MASEMSMKRSLILNELHELPLALAPPGLSAPPPLRVIAVTSGKGGVGKSNIVVNLGLALSRQGLKVLLIDADLGLANLDILLGLTPSYTIQDLLAHRQPLAEVMAEGPEGLKILPASSGIPELAELDEYQKMFLLNELDNYSETLDVVLIDTGAGISRNVLFFNLAAQERIVVANNEPTSITDAYALIKVLSTKYKKETFSILINSAQNGQEAKEAFRKISMTVDRFLGSISLDYLGYVPFDQKLPLAVKHQRPVLELYPQALSSRSFMEMAKNLMERPTPRRTYGNVQFFWQYLFQCQQSTGIDWRGD